VIHGTVHDDPGLIRPLRDRLLGRDGEMRVGLLVLDLHLVGCTSLKEKRRAVRSLIDRVRSRHNVAASEIDHHDRHQRAGIAFVSLAQTEDPLHRLFDAIYDEADRRMPGAIEEISREFVG